MSVPLARRVEAHLENCKQCSVLLAEELEFAQMLSALPLEEPANDMWALVRARTKPRVIRPFAWLYGLLGAPTFLKRGLAVVAVALIAALAIYSFGLVQPYRAAPVSQPSGMVMVKWSDDPLGPHADAIVDCIDKM
ncbi:MAG: hypothetical protein N3B12_00780 [Armatimonadetes bacterium]|nr:hypothetical protein [Armatimonadota bacterium]